MADQKVVTVEEQEKVLARAKEVGVRKAAAEFGLTWQRVASWNRAAAKEVAGAVEKAEKEVKSAAKKAEKAVKATEKKVKAAAKKVEKVEEPVAEEPVMEILIQSPLGGVITPEEIRARVGKADQVYVRVDENKAYWVLGEESGSVDLW